MTIMLTKHSHRGLVWVDLESPSQDELRKVATDYRLNPLVVHELASPTLKPKVDLYRDYAYLILHFPQGKRGNGQGARDLEVDFVVGKRFLITVRHGGSDVFHLFGKIFDANAALDKERLGAHAGFIFFHLLSNLYGALHHELGGVKESLREAEERIFQGEEREMVLALSHISRDLLDFRRSVSLHRDVLTSFEIAGRKLFGDDFSFHLRTLVGEYLRVEHSLEGNELSLTELRETNNSLVSTKQNEIMKTLTILAFIALPATTVLSLFQIDSVSRPIVGLPFDFWILVLLIAGIAAALYLWFKRQRWL